MIEKGGFPLRHCKTLPFLSLLAEKMEEGDQNRTLYEYLITHAPDEEHKNILAGIRNTEMTQEKLMAQLFFHLTGKRFSPRPVKSLGLPVSYRNGLELAYRRKTSAMLHSRQIALAIPNINQAMCMADIAADELKHSLLYLHLVRKIPRRL